jgi:predicted NBD/HSP70 family sugar kinase
MYMCIDVGGTKTIVACLDDNGVIIESNKFPTPPDYNVFLEEVKKVVASFKNQQFIAGSVGVPAVGIDREAGKAFKFANLQWRNVSVASDLEKIVKCPMFVENDTKLAGLSESMLIRDQFSKVLYMTISTGIGYAVINRLRIDTNAGDGGGRMILVKRDGKLVPWETIASGHAIFEQYGKLAKDIDDPATWQKISKDLAEGLEELIAVFQPEVIVVGGSVGRYFDKYGELLKTEIENYHLPFVDLPEFRGAQRPDDAVIYGCYDYAKQRLARINDD